MESIDFIFLKRQNNMFAKNFQLQGKEGIANFCLKSMQPYKGAFGHNKTAGKFKWSKNYTSATSTTADCN